MALLHCLRRVSRFAANHSRPIVVTLLGNFAGERAAMALSAGQTRVRISSPSASAPAWPTMPSGPVAGV